ncbi:MAG: hypothetical protein N3D17_03930 [bacterium]|nr:hypothetical protein [bacterium]
MEKNNLLWRNIKISGIISFITPFLLLIVGVILHKNGFTGIVENYEEGPAKFIQYVLFATGAGIFFFCDGISDFFSKRLSSAVKDTTHFYLLYVLFTIWLLNIISITGFMGFLICGNISWMVVFIILNLSIGIRYLPSQRRMQKLIATLKNKN